MSDYAFFLNRARDAAGVVSQLERAFASNPNDESLRLNLRTAVRLAERAEKELYEIAAAEQVDLLRYRLVRHTSNTFGVHGVSRSLELFQEAVTYIYEAVTGQPRLRAGLSKATKRDSELLFGYSYAGSLGVVLLAPSSRGLFLTKFDDVIETINDIFSINEQYRAKKGFKSATCNFYEGEILIFDRGAYSPYDDCFIYEFHNLSGESKI